LHLRPEWILNRWLRHCSRNRLLATHQARASAVCRCSDQCPLNARGQIPNADGAPARIILKVEQGASVRRTGGHSLRSAGMRQRLHGAQNLAPVCVQSQFPKVRRSGADCDGYAHLSVRLNCRRLCRIACGVCKLMRLFNLRQVGWVKANLPQVPTRAENNPVTRPTEQGSIGIINAPHPSQ
jgi:hypothetical protein